MMEKVEAFRFWDQTVKSWETKFHIVLLYVEAAGKKEICIPLKHT